MWHVTDWDQRRIISVQSPDERHDKDFVFEALSSFIDDIGSDVVLVTLTDDGAIESSSSSFLDDEAEILVYPSRIDYPP